MGSHEAFLIVALTWLVVSMVGVLPFLVAGSGTVASPVDALFESMSVFATRAAPVLREISVERHSR